MAKPDKTDAFQAAWERRISDFNAAYQRHKKYFVVAPPEFAKSRSEIFGFDIGVHITDVLPIILCDLRRPIKFDARAIARQSPVDGPFDVSKNIAVAEPKSFEQLKALVGVPHEIHEHCRCVGIESNATARWKPELLHVPAAGFEFEDLDSHQRRALHNLATYLLIGPADSETLMRPPFSVAAAYALDRARQLPVFVGNDLLVCPGETLSFEGFAAVYFNNVVVVGNGEIHFGNFTKLHTHQMRHV
jgi:hypothetical protein